LPILKLNGQKDSNATGSELNMTHVGSEKNSTHSRFENNRASQLPDQSHHAAAGTAT